MKSPFFFFFLEIKALTSTRPFPFFFSHSSVSVRKGSRSTQCPEGRDSTFYCVVVLLELVVIENEIIWGDGLPVCCFFFFSVQQQAGPT